jgi:RNA-directed DNA polymerase
LIALSNKTIGSFGRLGEARLAFVNRRLGDPTEDRAGEVQWLLPVGRHERIEPPDRGDAIADAFERARAPIGMNHEADVLEALPFDEVDDVRDVGVQIDVFPQQMRALAKPRQRWHEYFVAFLFELVSVNRRPILDADPKAQGVNFGTPNNSSRNALRCYGSSKEVFRRYQSQPVDRVVQLINPVLRGWVNYFAVGHSSACFSFIKDWVEKKVRRHMLRARKRKGFGWTRWSRSWLYETLKLFNSYRVRRLGPKVAPAG